MTLENLIAAALKFRAQKLWEVLDDSMIFAVRLPDGDMGYCCVMGNAGKHYALALYKGASGFDTYLKSIDIKRVQLGFELFQTFDYMNCDFTNASESNLTAARKKLIRNVANDNNIKMSRSKGYPEFVKFDRGLIRYELNQEEMESLFIALNAAINVAAKTKDKNAGQLKKLGFDTNGYYPSRDGGKPIPLLEMRPDGSFEWTVTTTPRVEGKTFSSPVFSNIFATAKLKAMNHVDSVLCKVMHMQAAVKCREGLYYPLMIILADDNGMAYPVMQRSDNPHCEEEVLNELASALISMQICPVKILVNDEFSEAFLNDFCKKTGISLKRVRSLPLLDEIVFMLNFNFGR